MLLTVSDISKFFGVSRETYYKWGRGGYPRSAREEHVKGKIRELLHAMASLGWPTPEAIAADSKDRYGLLLALLYGDE